MNKVKFIFNSVSDKYWNEQVKKVSLMVKLHFSLSKFNKFIIDKLYLLHREKLTKKSMISFSYWGSVAVTLCELSTYFFFFSHSTNQELDCVISVLNVFEPVRNILNNILVRTQEVSSWDETSKKKQSL